MLNNPEIVFQTLKMIYQKTFLKFGDRNRCLTSTIFKRPLAEPGLPVVRSPGTSFKISKKMSSSTTDSDNSIKSEDPDIGSLPEYDIEKEDGDLQMRPVLQSKSEENLDSCDLAYADVRMADENWLKAYEKELKVNEKLGRMLEEISSNITHTGHILDELCFLNVPS